MSRQVRIARPPQLARYAERLQRENIATVKRHSVWASLRDDCFAPGGMYERFGPSAVTRYHRVAEIVHPGNRDNLPLLIDHHAAYAYWQMLRWATSATPFCPLHNATLDKPRRLADLVVLFHEGQRDRMDPVLEGLREEADPDGYYENRYMELQAEWRDAMRAASVMAGDAPTRHKDRLRLCRQAARECFPDQLEWFDDLRVNVCNGGASGWWAKGDELRAKIE